MRGRAAAGGLALGLLAAAAPAGAASWTVEAYVDGFVPAALTVTAGDTVTWVNRSPVRHELAFDRDPTGTSPDPRWVLSRAPRTLVAARPGRYPYVCHWHGMFAVLTVRPGGP